MNPAGRNEGWQAVFRALLDRRSGCEDEVVRVTVSAPAVPGTGG